MTDKKKKEEDIPSCFDDFFECVSEKKEEFKQEVIEIEDREVREAEVIGEEELSDFLTGEEMDDLDNALDSTKKSRMITEEFLDTIVVEDQMTSSKETSIVPTNSITTMTDVLKPEDMGSLLLAEYKRASALNRPLDIIEAILHREGKKEELEQMTDETLMDLYEMFSRRQKVSQDFILKTLDLGMRTKMLSHLLDIPDDELSKIAGARKPTVTKQVSANSQRVSNMIRNVLDKRLGVMD